MENGVLTLRGERRFDGESNGKNYHRVERSYGHFVRSFTLPNNVDRERIQASFSGGLLEIALPKREDAKPGRSRSRRPMQRRTRRRRSKSRRADRVFLRSFEPRPCGAFFSPAGRVGLRGGPENPLSVVRSRSREKSRTASCSPPRCR